MPMLRKVLFALVVVAGGWGVKAHADDENVAPSAPDAGETIEVFDERPDKPFDRDTEIRLTGEQLAARGAVDLGTALALLPDVIVRDAGRGGFNIDIRGARKGEVSIFVDGVNVSDPYYGTFDVSTIPITDIVQIRLSTTPQSPIDGPGGPGGVVEVHTRDAFGEQLVIARVTGDTLPTFGATATARAALTKHLALRLSASGTAGLRELDAPMDQTIDEDRHAATGAGRLEYRDGNRRIVLDGFLDDRHYISPPSETSAILLIDRETTARTTAKYDDKLGKLAVQAQGWFSYLDRRSRNFSDPALQHQAASEHLEAYHAGAMALATRPIGKELRWAASVWFQKDAAIDSDQNLKYVEGDTSILEGAGDVQFERGKLRLDAAVGVAVPFGIDADPWPEAKVTAKYVAHRYLDVTATGAYKGRVPSLRERFDPNVGNPDLDAERDAHGELRAVAHVGDRVRIELAPFYKHTTNVIRVLMGKEANLGRVNFFGFDALARVRVHRLVEVGGSYDYVQARQLSDDAGNVFTEDPIDRLPRNRFDLFAQIAPLTKVSVLARVKYLGESFDRSNAAAPELDGYTLVEASITAQLSPAYLLVVRGDDLLDERPETRSGYHLQGRTVTAILQGTWQ